jgi:predicted membrane channel-forming protein YqfA (hemolysin III family)
MSRRDAILHLIGWLLFLSCAALFLVSGIRSGDALVLVGSLIFLAACLVFIVPLIPFLRSGSKEHEGSSSIENERKL